MSIQNELNSDIALALIARGGRDPERLKEMKELIFRIHATLQGRLAQANRKQSRTQAASGNQKSPAEA
jgi:hypothetical protein